MDRYERIKTLGRGAFGVAVLVREKGAHPAASPGPLRVVKEVDLGQLPASARKDAQNEVIVLARFKHPNIVEYCTAFIDTDKQTLHIVMEYADGGDLAALIRQRKEDQGRFSEGDALVILAQCLEALVHIHSKNVLHRDIKGQNIFAMKNGTVKLGDFGIARVLEHTASVAKTMIGTPNYLAPEVCENLPYNDRADIWSLGVVFYELLTLQQPFQAYNMAALVLKIVTAEPAPLSPDYGPEVTDIVQRTLNKKPEQRPGASELLNLPAVRCLVGSRFQLTDSSAGRSALKSPSVLHAGSTGHVPSSHEPNILRVEHAPSMEQYHTAIEEGEEEFLTAVDAVDELRQQLEARSPAPRSFGVDLRDAPSHAPVEALPAQTLLCQPTQTLLGQPAQTLLGQPAQTMLGQPAQEMIIPHEQTRLNKEMLSPRELARLNKARVQGAPLNHAPWQTGEGFEEPVRQTHMRQVAHESQNPWEWQSIAAQAELERRRNKERLTRQNWHGPGLGFLGGMNYEHTPMGTSAANGWRQEEEPVEGRGLPRTPPGQDRQGAHMRSSSASSLGVAGSVVARSRPAPLGGSTSSDGAPVGSPGRIARLNMGQSDATESSNRSSPRVVSRHGVVNGADLPPSIDACASPGSVVVSRPQTGSSLGGYDAGRRHPSTGSTARQRLVMDPAMGMEAGRPPTHSGLPSAATPGAAASRVPSAARSGATASDLARRRSPSGARGRPAPAGPSPSATQSSGWQPAVAASGPVMGAGRRASAARSGSRQRQGTAGGTLHAAEVAAPPPTSHGRADDLRPPSGGGKRETRPSSRRVSTPAAAETAPRPGSRRASAAAVKQAEATSQEAPAAELGPPTPAMLAERFAWASKFADAPLDMQLPAYADRKGENERLGELDSLFSEIARLSDADRGAEAKEEPTLIPDAAKGTVGATLAGGIGFFDQGDMTEDWNGAEMFNDADGFASNVTKMQEGTASHQDILAAALRA